MQFKTFVEAFDPEIVAWADAFFDTANHSVDSHNQLRIMADFLEDRGDPLGTMLRSRYSHEVNNSLSRRDRQRLLDAVFVEYPDARQARVMALSSRASMRDHLPSVLNVVRSGTFAWEIDNNRWYSVVGRRLPSPVTRADVPPRDRVAIFVHYMTWRFRNGY